MFFFEKNKRGLFYLLQPSIFFKVQTIINMVGAAKIILLILFITPAVVSNNCTNASQPQCGQLGGACASYNYTNGTCTPSACSTDSYVKVWSNSTFSCISCHITTKSICESSCSAYGFYYDSSSNILSCTKCTNKYGIFCSKCDSSQCLACSNQKELSKDNQSCANAACNISHCQTCQNDICAKCDQNYSIYQKTCICLIKNCEVCAESACLKCSNGYYLSPKDKSCSIKCIDNCKGCQSLSSCTACISGYYYTNHTNKCLLNCTSISPHCQLCYSPASCSKCISNFTVSLNGRDCIPACIDSYCNSCTNIIKCEGCMKGYKLNQSKNCVKDICSIRNCQICQSSSTCLQCKQLYQLKNNNKACLANCGVNNCQYCQSKTTCTVCIDGYKIINGKCSKSCSIQNCGVCWNEQACFSCNRGYKLTQNNQFCQYDCGIYKCLSCNSTFTCEVCYPGFTLSSNFKCVVVCQKGLFQNSTTKVCQSCPDNCALCDSKGLCLACRYLYFLNSTSLTCTSCSTIQNCFECESTRDVCTICKKGYDLINGVCKNENSSCSISNCQVCQSNKTCQICSTGFILVAGNGTCQQIICPTDQFLILQSCTCGPKSYMQNDQCISCVDSNCLSCTSSICFQCSNGYYANGLSCQPCKSGCETCDLAGCSSCKNGFFKKGEACQPFTSRRSSLSHNGSIIRCMPGCKSCDIDQRQNIVCLQEDERYVLVSGQIFVCESLCLTCADTLQNGSYSICLSCPKSFILINGACLSCNDINAQECSNSNRSFSLTCSPGYNAQSGTCKSCSNNCLKCGSQGSSKCDVGGCSQGFFQSKGEYQCVKCFNGCSFCESNPNICLECGDYKYLKGNICYLCPSNCIKCTDANSCTMCSIGFIFVNGTCITPNISGCIEYTQNIKCSLCGQYYRLSGGLCQLNMACNLSKKTCQNCVYNYFLSNGSCIQCPALSNYNSCDQLNPQSCIQCVSGYYLGASKNCVACQQQGCKTCSSLVTCTSAKDGYYLVNDISGLPSGKVGQCGGMCATCINDALNCLSCKPSSSFIGSQCVSDNHYKISYVGYLKSLGKNASESGSYQVGLMINIFPRFLSQIGQALGYNSLASFMQNLNVESVVYQSIAVNFSTNYATTKNDPAVALNNAVLTDLQLVALSVTGSSSNNHQEQILNLGLIFGISIPLGLLILIIAIAVIKMKRSSNETQDQQLQEQTDKQLKDNQDQPVQTMEAFKNKNEFVDIHPLEPTDKAQYKQNNAQYESEPDMKVEVGKQQPDL